MKSSNRDDGWLTGRLYFNREDKRVIIKRPRSGFGYTMNLGNKWTWILNIIFVIIIVILVSKKFAQLKKPTNPSRFQTRPAVPELFALCVIPAVFLKGEKNVFADSTLRPLPKPCLWTVSSGNGSGWDGVFQ